MTDNPISFDLTPDDIENLRKSAEAAWEAGWRPEIKPMPDVNTDERYSVPVTDAPVITYEATNFITTGKSLEVARITPDNRLFINPNAVLVCEDWKAFFANNPEFVDALREAWVTVPTPKRKKPEEWRGLIRPSEGE